MKTARNRFTALLLALALALSLAGVSLAANPDTSAPAEPAVAAASAQGEKTASEQEESAAEESTSEQQEESAAEESTSEQQEESAAEESTSEQQEESAAEEGTSERQEESAAEESASERQEESAAKESTPEQQELVPQENQTPAPAQTSPQPQTPADIWWQTGADSYAAKVAYEYNGKERRPGYRVMREGKEIERQSTWQEHWYADEACTREAKDFVSCAAIYLRITDADTLVAQGSYSIVPAAQKLTAKPVVQKLFKSKSVFDLGVKNSGPGALTYASSDPKVVTVDKKGKCTMVGVGTATITVTAAAKGNYRLTRGQVEVQLYKKAKKLSYSKAYKKGKYYKNLLNLKLTGTSGENVVDIALSQLGYKEGRRYGQMAGNGRGKGNWTEYGRYYGMNQQPWCAMFVNWCAREAGISYATVPKYAAVRYYHSYFKRKGVFHAWSKVRSGKYKPKKGDIIIYAYSKGGVAHHIGYVVDCSYEGDRVKLTTVEGNTHDKVKKVSMNLSAKGSGKNDGHYILGMASPRY